MLHVGSCWCRGLLKASFAACGSVFMPGGGLLEAARDADLQGPGASNRRRLLSGLDLSKYVALPMLQALLSHEILGPRELMDALGKAKSCLCDPFWSSKACQAGVFSVGSIPTPCRVALQWQILICASEMDLEAQNQQENSHRPRRSWRSTDICPPFGALRNYLKKALLLEAS